MANDKKSPLERLWEIIPGALTWGSIFGMIILIWKAPFAAAIFVLVYAIFWLIKIFIMTSFLIAGFVNYRRALKINWLDRLKNDFPDHWNDLYHLIIMPTYKEDISILRATLDTVKKSNYSSDRIILVVAFEERDRLLRPQFIPLLEKEYAKQFAYFTTTVHPDGLLGEIKGKGPNITWAARAIKPYLEKRGIPFSNIIATSLDADSRVDKNYFANVSWAYLHDPDPVKKSFQPLPMYFNNIWSIPLPVKLTNLGSSFWQMTQAMRPHYARNFASHAQSYEALVKTDFWSTKTIVEDGHQYWRSYFAYGGDYEVVPIFTPIYMDAVEGRDLPDTFYQQYLQRRRWYWGVSDVPFVFMRTYHNKKIPFFYKWLQLGRLLESHYSLATQSFFLAVGWLPLIIHPSLHQTILGYNFPIVYRSFLTAAWIGMIAMMLIASHIVPQRPGHRAVHWLTIVKEWILAPIALPVSAILFSALPAIDSQTRLMFNKPFTVFNVTPKKPVATGFNPKSKSQTPKLQSKI